ncbi:MAG: DNA-3-methyladenine glycosylase I [Candidatus Thermoplasmatota archaeon]|nr:DNA-3-methyladenine glycosylase I [Candidatus Thermoplasmatota archaeon]
MPSKIRCPWTLDNPFMNEYHDQEWGVPLHEDKKLFEFIVLDTFQAGLSWLIVLKKRDGFQEAFGGFDPEKVACFTEEDVERLAGDAGIIRNRQKIRATVENARVFLRLQKEYGSFDRYIWGRVGGEPIINHWTRLNQLPARTELSDKMSSELKKEGFKFAGSTICYAFMQATGMVNDHLVSCFRHSEVGQK